MGNALKIARKLWILNTLNARVGLTVSCAPNTYVKCHTKARGGKYVTCVRGRRAVDFTITPCWISADGLAAWAQTNICLLFDTAVTLSLLLTLGFFINFKSTKNVSYTNYES